MELYCCRLLVDHPDNRMVKKDLETHCPQIKEMMKTQHFSFNEACSSLQRAMGRVYSDQENAEMNADIGRKNPAQQVCAQCSKPGAPKECSRCQQTSYCGRECQQKHWKKHKKVCKELVKKQQASMKG